MSKNVNRRKFLKASLLASTGAGLNFRFEEKNLLARNKQDKQEKIEPQVNPPYDILPQGKLGDLNISRIICGGNLISGFAHSRDLIYVSKLLRNYFTDEKIFETLQKCEAQEINTAILRLDNKTLKIINKYWHEIGGKIQWIAQCKLPAEDWKSDILRAIDNGADAAYLHGGVAEGLLQENNIELIGQEVELIRGNGVPAGIAGHMIEVPIAIRESNIEVDFYMKTLNAKNYWSAGPKPRNDSVWAETPEKTIEVMDSIEKPWVAYKVLGAGAIHPKAGFRYALENGADFLCVGMFDFQVEEDVAYANEILANLPNRVRPWRA